MIYTEQQPGPALAKQLECVWFVSEQGVPAPTGAPERVLPDGCLEWIFHLGEPFQRARASGAWELQPRSFVVGGLTRFLLLQPTGPIAIMGVRFRPGGAYRFIPFPLALLTDSMLPTGEIWGREGTLLEAAVMEESTNFRRQQLVEEFLLRQLSVSAPRRRFEAAVSEIIGSRGQCRVHELAHRIGWSSRQFEREFQVGLGLSPKTLARIIRFQNLLRLVGEGPLRQWACLSLEGGYSDQPHMVREFREFSGQSPGERDRSISGDLVQHFVSPRRLAALLGSS